jgi:hypothetical protein
MLVEADVALQVLHAQAGLLCEADLGGPRQAGG